MARSRRSWGSVRQIDGGRFQARYIDLDTRKLTPAPQTFSTKSAADRWLCEEAHRAPITGTATDDRAGSRRLAEWWPGYWDSVQSHKPRTKIGYETAWRLRIEPRFGSMPVRRIKARHVDEWIAEMTKSGVSASKVIEGPAGVLRASASIRWSETRLGSRQTRVRRGERTSRLPKRPKTDRPVLTPPEVERLAMAIAEREGRSRSCAALGVDRGAHR